MTKRAKWWRDAREAPPKWLHDLAREGAPMTRQDFAALEHWIEALEAIDEHNDKGPLLALLKGDCPLPHAARRYLVDFLERHEFKKKRGAQRTPLYAITDAEATLALAIDDVCDAVTIDGKSAATALNEVSRARGIPRDSLRIAYEGRRGATNRRKKK